jgi:hypothetical protein
MSSFDFYAAARGLISYLEQTSHMAAAELLRAAVEEGATSTEILMALRFHLANIIKQVPLEEDASTLASRLLVELEHVLE